jgi:hypothetical protein
LDGSKISGAKIFSLDQSALWVEVLTPGLEGVSSTDILSFHASSIDYVRSMGPRASLIHLKSGAEAAVRMPLNELMDRLQSPDGPVLDLKKLSYLETKAALAQRIQQEFKEAAEAEKYAALENLTFHAWVRPANKAEFTEFTFAGRDVRMRNLSEGDSIMGGRNIRFTMNEGVRAPFDAAEFIMEGTIEELRKKCVEAYGCGDAEIDLREYSLRKGTVPPSEERPAVRKAPQP